MSLVARCDKMLRRCGIDAFVLSVFASGLMGFGNIYYGLARRALDKSVAAAKSKNSVGLTRSMAYHPEVQMVIELESIGPHWTGLQRIGPMGWTTASNGRPKFSAQNLVQSKDSGVWSISGSISPAEVAYFALGATNVYSGMHVSGEFILRIAF